MVHFRCVIVEDHTMFQQLLRATLRGISWLDVVAMEQTSAAGIRACQEFRPDLLILDLGLPDDCGLAVARSLVAVNPEAKIVILSGQSASFVCPASLHANLHAVINKTEAVDAVETALEGLQEKVRMRNRLEERAPVRRGGAGLNRLTPRELKIFEFMGYGLPSKQIAAELHISLHTVQAHRKKIAAKLGTSGDELSRQAFRYYWEANGGNVRALPGGEGREAPGVRPLRLSRPAELVRH